MQKITYFVGRDDLSIRTIQKARARKCDLAIQVTSTFVKVYELTEVSITEAGFQTNSTAINDDRPAYITQKNLEDVIETLSKHFEIEKIS